MRRNFRKSSNYVDSKVITFSILGVLLLSTVVFGILMYGKSVNDDVRSGQLSVEQIASIKEKEQESESASTQIGKSIEEAEKENVKEDLSTKEEKSEENTNKTAETIESLLNNTSNTEKQTEKKQDSTTTKNVATTVKAEPKEVKKELSFQKPVEGEIMRQFAKENLVYSETLSEWVTHLGIDIKADKTTVVNSAEEGTIKSIKNDPRYGLTIVVSHQDGFETVYANLLSSEFVKEGDKVTKGQAIGTVGNTGVFESVDEPHLHFEILKDSTQIDPSLYIK
ncbi:MAG: peptidoglycan DD-metalloendopeptidase family protein [Clostridia bacterium]|nr:peptidoglycan DD-metalloendopeptidase family protein [Clostridia bacterium]